MAPSPDRRRAAGPRPEYEAPHEEFPKLPPRPSYVPDNYGILLPGIEEEDEENLSEVVFGTAVQGRVTRCQRVLTVRRIRPVPSIPLPIEEKDEEELSEVGFGTAVQGRVTGSPRVALRLC